MRQPRRPEPSVAREREAIARLSPGGAPDNPVELSSASQVDIRAEATPCPLCGGQLRLDEHIVRERGPARLRVARVHCHHCGTARELYYRLREARAN